MQNLRSLMILSELNMIERIMENVEQCENSSVANMETVIDLLLWRHSQSLSQGNCFKSSILRNDYGQNTLRTSFDNKNFKSFRHFISKYHTKFGFDIVALTLARTTSYCFVPLIIKKMVIHHNNDCNVLHQYQSVIIKHFESFSSKLLSSDAASDCYQHFVEYFGSIKSAEQPWLYALLFVIEAVSMTDDEVWMNCFKFIMAEIGDICQQLNKHMSATKVDEDERTYYVEDERVRSSLVCVLDGIWARVKNTKYMKDGIMLKQFRAIIASPIKGCGKDQ